MSVEMTVAVTEANAEVPGPEVETIPDEERFVPCSKPGCQNKVDLTRIPAKVRHLDHSTLLCKKCAHEKSVAKANRASQQGPKRDAPQRQPRTQAPAPVAEAPTPDDDMLVSLIAVREALIFLRLPTAQVDIIISMLKTRAAPSSDK